MTINEKRSLPSFLKLIEEFYSFSSGALWFRGVGNESSHKLIPTLYRNDTHDIETILRYDAEISDSFSHKGIAYNDYVRENDYLKNLFILQHHGCPTRLLDWTENPLYAMFFALESAKKLQKTKLKQENACVWVLDPILWNNMVYSRYSANPPNRIFSLKDMETKRYDISQLITSDIKYPTAITGIHNSSRIVAQKGTFVIFGKSKLSMDEMLIDFTPSFSNVLRKIILPYRCVDDLFNSITKYGTTSSVLFPDLDGLCRDFKRQYGYGV